MVSECFVLCAFMYSTASSTESTTRTAITCQELHANPDPPRVRRSRDQHGKDLPSQRALPARASRLEAYFANAERRRKTAPPCRGAPEHSSELQAAGFDLEFSAMATAIWIGVRIYIPMADARTSFDHRNAGGFDHAANQDAPPREEPTSICRGADVQSTSA